MRDLFDKFYEHPVDRVRELGQTSGFHRRDYFGEIKKNDLYQSNLDNENKLGNEQQIQENNETNQKRGSISDALFNLAYQEYSFLYILVGTAWIVLMILFFFQVAQSPYQDGKYQIPTNQSLLSLNLYESELQILDYHSETLPQQPYYLNYDCYSNTFDETDKNSSFSNCIITLYINQSYQYHHTPIEKLSISCYGEQKCLIQIKSNSLIAEHIEFNGYNLHLRASTITAKKFIFDSYLGSVQIMNLNSADSIVKTSIGDIVIQTYSNVILDTTTIDRLVCATAPIALKANQNGIENEYVQISYLDTYFEKSYGEVCQLIKQNGSIKKQKYLKELNHHFKNKRTSEQFNNPTDDDENHLNEISCSRLRNIILLNSEDVELYHDDNISELQQLSIFNEKGNVFVNVLNHQGHFSEPIYNSIYKNNEISFSNTTQSFLSQHLENKKVKDLAYLILKINFDDRQGIFTKDNQIIVAFNFQYSYLSPWWVSTLTFNTLNFNVVEHDLLVTPNICPYYLSNSVTTTVTTNESHSRYQYDSIIFEKVQTFITALQINDVSYRFNGQFMNQQETAYTIFVVFGIIIVVLCAIGSIMMHMYFYRKVEIDRNFLKRKAFEMWIFMTMNLFEKKQYTEQNEQSLQILQNQFGMSSNIYQSQQLTVNQNITQSFKAVSFQFDQVLGLLNRLLDSSVLLNYNEITSDEQRYDIAPLVQSLLQQPINLMMKHEVSRYMPIKINYCILCSDIQCIQEIEKQFTYISKYITTNSNLPTEDKVITFSQKIQNFINQKSPPFILQNRNNYSVEILNSFSQSQQQLQYILLNQSVYYLRDSIDLWEKTQSNPNNNNLLSLDINLQDDMLDQLSQLYLKCKNSCPQIFEQIASNDQEKISIYMDTLQDTMKMYNIYTQITKQLSQIQSNYLVRGLCENMRTINYIFDSIYTSTYQQNFITVLFQFWQYLSVLKISQYQSQQNGSQQQQNGNLFQSQIQNNQNFVEMNNSYQFNQSSYYNQANYTNTNEFNYIGQQNNNNQQSSMNPKSIKIVQKYDYYPTFTNMINVLQCLTKTSKSTISCFCELIFAEIPQSNNHNNNNHMNQIEYCDDITLDKFREYYAVYCYALNCNEEVLEPNQQLNDILQKFMYAVDGSYIRAFSSTGKYKIYRGLMEYLFYAVNLAPKKNHEMILQQDFSKYLYKYRQYLLKHSYKINKINAYTIFETISQYIYILFLLNLPFILCMPIIFAQSAYAYAYFSFQYADNIYFQTGYDHFFTIFCSSGFPITVFVITFTFIFICAIDTLFYFTKPRLDKNNFYISYFKIIFTDFFNSSTQNQGQYQQNFQKQNVSPYLLDDLRYSSHGLNNNINYQQQFQNNQFQQQNPPKQVNNLYDADGEKIPQDRYSNKTSQYYFKLTYQIMFQILLWSLVGFNTFFFFITLMILTISSFIYLEQGLLLAIFLLTLIGVLFLRSRNLKRTYKNTKQHLQVSWERLLICEITQQYAVNLTLSSHMIENFMKDKNLDEKYYRRNRIIATVKSNSFYDEQSGAIYQYSHPQKIVISQQQFKEAIEYLIDRGVNQCLKLLRISASDIVSELAEQAIIQFVVFMICSLIVDYFNLCTTGFALVLNAIFTIIVAIFIFNTLDKKQSHINAQTLDNSINYISRVQCRVGITIFTQNIGFQQL